MEPEFWLKKWEANDIQSHQDDVNENLIEFWPRLQLNRDARVLVPLCGKSGDVLWIAEQGPSVVGVELSRLAVEAFFHENSLEHEVDPHDTFERWSCGNIKIVRGDFLSIDTAEIGEVDAVYDRASLVALPSAMRKRYAEHIHTLSRAGTRVLLLSVEYPDGEMEGPPFSVTEQEINDLYGDAWDIETLLVHDVLDRVPRFKDRGLTKLEEKIYMLTKRA